MKLAKNYSKECHLNLLPCGDNNILENIHFLYDENWKNQGASYPYEILTYADAKQTESPSRLRVYSDAELTTIEHSLMETYISKLSEYSQYVPQLDNAKDRGEVKSLSFMAVKKFLYFAANDTLPKRLIREADELKTGLDDIELLEMYDVIYYLYRTDRYPKDGLRLLYKYEYYLTSREKQENPNWGDFIQEMDLLYG